MLLFPIGVIMMVVGAAILAIVLVLKIVQGLLWVFIKVLECFVKTPLPERIEPTLVMDSGVVIDLHRKEWRVIK